MRLHDRYFFRELLTPMAICLGGFLVFWASFFFFTELEHMREASLHFVESLEYAVAMMPGFFITVLPITLLLALLYALTHHARHNEITALRAAGVGLWRLCAPYFIVGLATTGIYFVLNEIVVPRCTGWSEEILSRHVQKPVNANAKPKGFSNRQANRVWQFGAYNPATVTMINPIVTWTSADRVAHVIRAARAQLTNSVWMFYDAQFLVRTNQQAGLAKDFFTNAIAMPAFEETAERIRLELKFNDAQTLRASRSADIPLFELWTYLWHHPELTGEDANRLRTKFHGRLAAPFTCLVVVLIAIPFGAQPGRRNLFFGVAGSIFIAFAFFVLQSVGMALGAGGHLPGWLAAWLPNMIFAVTGIWLIFRIR